MGGGGTDGKRTEKGSKRGRNKVKKDGICRTRVDFGERVGEDGDGKREKKSVFSIEEIGALVLR